ncbi:MAG: biotin/lipoyl-containing protein, partial [Cucumibacter sp.]
MSVNITMPALSPTMEHGTIVKWLVKEGDTVSSGDVIAEIETDKATMEVEAVDEGKIGKIVVPEGTENVAVNSVIAILLQEGETATDAKPPEAAAKPAVSPAKPAPQAPKPVAATPEAKPIAAPAAVPRLNGATRIFASPLARRLAAESKIDLAALTGSGPHGRIVKRDIDKSLKDGVPSSAS